MQSAFGIRQSSVLIVSYGHLKSLKVHPMSGNIYGFLEDPYKKNVKVELRSSCYYFLFIC